ncbi:MAG: sugar phosphate isomerase/epimerase family protein [Planctomycetota bacterium]|nr:sugar phosphate isomerase/epimerase family protein [Planctomycetota bacterium]
MKPAFSTVALPAWTLPRIAERADAWGFLGVEFRTFGHGSSAIAGDPALTSPAKVRSLFAKSGVRFVSLATSIRYDEPITPPLLGQLFDTERSVRETTGAVDLAVQLECPLVRVFAFEVIGNESRTNALGRITRRLAKAIDHCDKSGVRLVLENGGSFNRAADLAEIIDLVDSPLLGVAYNLAVGVRAGDVPADAVNVLGDRLLTVKVRDFKDGVPCALGEGDLDCRRHVADLARAGYTGWLVHEYDGAWFPGSPDADAVLARSARTLFEWASPASRPATSAR